MSNRLSTAVTVPETDPVVPTPTRGPGSAERLQFPDIPRLELDQLLEQLRDRAGDVLATQGRLRGLLRANAAVAADLTLPVLLRHIVTAARGLLRARYAAMVVLGPDTEVQQFVHAGVDGALAARVGLVTDLRGVVELLAACPDADPRTVRPSGSGLIPPLDPPVAVFIAIPIGAREVFGHLYLRATPGEVFSTDDVQLVTAFAVTAGGAIANARLLSESEQRRRWLTTSGHLTTELLAAGTVHPLTCISQAGMTAADADYATLTVPLGTGEVLTAAAAGAAGQALVGSITAITDSPAGPTIRTGAPVLLTGHRTAGAVHITDPAAGPVMMVPLSAGGHVRGAITIGRRPGRVAFTPADLDMAVTFGTHATVALALAEARDGQIRDARLADHDRIAFELHDHVIGELFAVGMGLQGLAGATHDPARAQRLGKYVDGLDRVISTIRTAIFQLQPRRHDPTGLQTRILAIADTHTEQLGYRPQLHFSGPLDHINNEPLATDILAVNREALSNCARHAHANQVTIAVGVTNNIVTVQITDNGRGIGTPTRSSGLTNLRSRAHNHAGTLTITEPPNGGTRLTWSAHCTPPRQPDTATGP